MPSLHLGLLLGLQKGNVEAGEAEFPARRSPLPLHAAENPRPQVPPGREVLHRLLGLTSANSPASPQLGREDRLFLICQILKEF